MILMMRAEYGLRFSKPRASGDDPRGDEGRYRDLT